MMEKAQGMRMIRGAGSSSDGMLMRLREEKEELERTAKELGRLAESRVLSKHLEEAKRDEKTKKMRVEEKISCETRLRKLLDDE